MYKTPESDNWQLHGQSRTSSSHKFTTKGVNEGKYSKDTDIDTGMNLNILRYRLYFLGRQIALCSLSPSTKHFLFK